MQNSTKDLKFLKEQREIVWKRTNVFFEIVSNRQTKIQESYRKECEKNDSYLTTQIDRCVSLSYNSTNWKYSRDFFKTIQSEMKDLKLEKESRQKHYNRLQESFERLNSRQNEEKRRYDEKSNSNYARLDAKISDILNSIYYSDGDNLKSLREELKYIQSELKNCTLNRDHRQELFESVNNCFSKLQSKQEAFYEQIKRERETKRRDFIRVLEEKADKLSGSIIHDENIVYDKEQKLLYVRPGNKEYEIKESLRNAIYSINEKIYSKKETLQKIRDKIREVESQNWCKTQKSPRIEDFLLFKY